MKLAKMDVKAPTTVKRTKSSQSCMIALDKLRNSEWHPGARTTESDKAIDRLGASMQRHGQLHPICVLERDGEYVILSGHRRIEAAKKLGWKTIEARVYTGDFASECFLAENLGRKQLDPISEARALQAWLNEEGLTHEAGAERMGRSRNYITATLSVLVLPKEVQAEAVGLGNKISRSNLIEVAQGNSVDEQKRLWKVARTGAPRDEIRKKKVSTARKSTKRGLDSDKKSVVRASKLLERISPNVWESRSDELDSFAEEFLSLKRVIARHHMGQVGYILKAK